MSIETGDPIERPVKQPANSRSLPRERPAPRRGIRLD
jgi:hypothetical protein